ncbi:Astra associated protein 1 Asa1 [Coniothyrium glycines]
MAPDRQASAQPPAQPSFILRGHASQIHSVRFLRHNTRLLTGDADGYIVFWKVETKRPLAVWHAHDGAILGTAAWGHDKIITHGRDNSLRIWQLRPSDEASLSSVLPAEEPKSPRPKPWLLHTLPVNTLNFCAFSMYHTQAPTQGRNPDHETTEDDSSTTHDGSILIAVPARDDKKAEVYQFPEERIKFVVPRAQSADTGMIMALKLTHHRPSNCTLLLVGYEGGFTAAFVLSHNKGSAATGVAELVYLSQPHSQPILSLDVSPDGTTYFTSSADAIIAAHRIPDFAAATNEGPGQSTADVSATSTNNTRDASTISHTTNSASSPTQQTSTVLTQDQPSKAQAACITSHPEEETLNFSKQSLSYAAHSNGKSAGLTSLLSSSNPAPLSQAAPTPPPVVTIQSPYKVADTKHAGQQSLCIRSDGRIMATGGWDSRIRIYSTKTLKEVAVLKWHKEGVYAVDFGEILEAGDLRNQNVYNDGRNTELIRKESGLSKLQRQREEQMQLKHWIAGGAKDGKVSLWEVF